MGTSGKEVSSFQLKEFSEVHYLKTGIGFFPSFNNFPIKHGFSWGTDSPNMAYKWHKGDPNTITRFNNKFLNDLGMESLSHSVLMEAYANIDIVDVNNSFLSATKSTEKGRFTPTHIIFTTIPKIPIVLKTGDYTASLVYGITKEKQSLIGIIHSGRNELTAKIPQKGIEYMKNKYGCDPSTIQIGILPCLGVKNHFIKSEDISDRAKDLDAWNQHMDKDNQGNVFLDMQQSLLSQFVDAGILSNNIEIYKIDTYEAAIRGESFSHRFAVTNQLPERNGRFMISIQLI